jgi:hypothetical protein
VEVLKVKLSRFLRMIDYLAESILRCLLKLSLSFFLFGQIFLGYVWFRLVQFAVNYGFICD